MVGIVYRSIEYSTNLTRSILLLVWWCRSPHTLATTRPQHKSDATHTPHTPYLIASSSLLPPEKRRRAASLAPFHVAPSVGTSRRHVAAGTTDAASPEPMDRRQNDSSIGRLGTCLFVATICSVVVVRSAVHADERESKERKRTHRRQHSYSTVQHLEVWKHRKHYIIYHCLLDGTSTLYHTVHAHNGGRVRLFALSLYTVQCKVSLACGLY
jgi:hypothetical protein